MNFLVVSQAVLAFALSAAVASATTEKFRLIWNGSPESSVTVAWCQRDGTNAHVHYGRAADTTAEGEAAYFPLAHGVDRATSHLGLESRFARLSGLEPDTLYRFVIRDDNSESPRFLFRTAPAGPAAFTFVAGGDSRNHRDARQRANRAVSRLRPLFVCFGGDMISKPTREEWSDWLDDWQLTAGEDGRLFPIVPARGNHESNRDIHDLFDTPHPDDYYAFDIGGPGFLRLYTLNSNIVRAGSQGAWLAADLADHGSSRWKVAQYHHPFRPHHSAKAEQHAQYNAWAPAFFEHGVDLAIECDSHVVKRTWPVRPSNEPGSTEGFIRDDTAGITFIGEGCWGAPLRQNDDDKPWTRASGRFNQVNWIGVTPDRMTVRTILVDRLGDEASSVDDASPLELPDGLEIWEPESGAVVSILPLVEGGRRNLPAASLARVKILASETGGGAMVRIEIVGGPVDGAEIRLTTDGSEPDGRSRRYSEPFKVRSGAAVTVRAAVFRDGKALTAAESIDIP